jgi:NAD dependent epimerase/dehydratase family enzyme
MIGIKFKSHKLLLPLCTEYVTFGTSLHTVISQYNDKHVRKIDSIYNLHGQEITQKLWGVSMKEHIDLYVDKKD